MQFIDTEIFNIGGLIFAEILGDFALKEYAKQSLISSLCIGIFGYIGVVVFLIRSLRQSQILYVNAMWDGWSALIESLAAIFILGERFDDPRKYFGIALIIAGLFFLRSPVVQTKVIHSE
jgi:multidrug transporter EmrE-like cation transporter